MASPIAALANYIFGWLKLIRVWPFPTSARIVNLCEGILSGQGFTIVGTLVEVTIVKHELFREFGGMLPHKFFFLNEHVEIEFGEIFW